MSEMQKSFLRTCGCVLGGLIVVAISIVGAAYQWAWVACVWAIIGGVFLVYGIAIVVSEMIYKWRVWGAILPDEEDMYHYWKFAIFDGRINCMISKMEFHEFDDEFDEEAYYRNYDFLLKMQKVPIPKILTIGA